MKGAVKIREVPIPDPLFRYARWCSDFDITDLGSDRVIGAVSIGGREGHVTSTEAMSRAFRVMKQELTSHLAKTLAAYIYGESTPPAARPPAACAKKDGRYFGWPVTIVTSAVFPDEQTSLSQPTLFN